MQLSITRRACDVRRFAFLFSLLLCFGALFPSLAFAQDSAYCPQVFATVAKGASVQIDVSDCDGPFDGGMSEPFAGFGASSGTVTIEPNNAGTQFVTYAHGGNTATSDTFFLEDNDGAMVQVNMTITAPASAIVVSPASLPAMTAGTAFSQALSSTGGNGTYAYTLNGGALPVGLNLAPGGLINGTPTQRGPYSFTVRSTDGASAFVDKGYTGSVANPSLALGASTINVPQNVATSQSLTATGGVAPYVFTIESGTLPAGLTLSAAGLVSGTTNVATGNYTVTVRVTDASSGPGSYFELETLTIAVSALPSVSISVAPASVAEDGATNLVYTISRGAASSGVLTVNLTYGGTATAGTDYAGNAATVNIPNGSSSTTITLDPASDATVEANETAIVTVATGAGYLVGAPAAATGTINNDDVPSVSVTVSPASVTEDGVANLVYTLTLDQPSLAPISVNWAFGAGSATPGVDFANVSGPLVIAAGATNGQIVVDPTADATIEANESVLVVLNPGTGYTMAPPINATGTILNDDLPTLSINDVSIAEGDAGTTTATFTVSLSAPAPAGGVTFDIATQGGTATSGTDFVAQSLTGQTIPAGSTTYTFSVAINGDVLNETSETYFVNVTNVVNALVADGQGLGTITNDDAVPSISIDDLSTNEGNVATTANAVAVRLSAPSGQTVTVNYATADGTATAPGDYAATSGTVSFAPGATTRTIVVGIVGDISPEANETFNVNLSAPVNATIADASATVTLLNDDVPVSITTATLPNAAVAAPYTQTITATGGAAPYSYAVTAGALPAGLTLSPLGTVSGTPTAGGTFNFTVTATDSSPSPGPFTASRAYTLVVNAATITLPATTLPGGTLSQAYNAALNAASGGTAPYSYAVASGALPNGLTLNASTGAITGTPTAMGTFNFTIVATDGSGGSGPYSSAPRAYSIGITDVTPVANASTHAAAYDSAAAAVTLDITGGAPTNVAVATGASNGTATATGVTINYQPNAGFAGTDSFTYTATNSGGTSPPATVTVTVGNPTIAIATTAGFNATVATAYTQTFTFSGGAAPYAGYQVTNLPAGVSITGTTANSVTISGTPTQAGTFALAVSSTDSSTGNGPFTTTQTFSLDVAVPTLALAPGATTFNVPYATAFSQAFTASGGVGPYTYALTGTLPTGVTFAGDTLSGTPTMPGTYNLTLTATDAGSTGVGAPFTVAQSYTIVVAAPSIVVTPATVPNATAGTAYSQTLSATGAVAPYTFTITAGALPAGVTLSTNGALAGTPSASGTFNFTAQASDANGQVATQAYTLIVAVPAIALTPATLAGGTAGTAYTQALTISGGIAPYTATLTGTLPTGIAFDTTTRTFSGTPTQAGSFNVSVTVADSTGGTAATVTNAYTLVIASPTLSLTPATLAAGTAGVAYAQSFATTGGIAPYTYALTAGALPAGLALNASTGALSGTPTVAGNFNFTVAVVDSTTGTAASASNAYTLAISAPTITITPTTLTAGTQNQAYAQTLTATGGSAPYTFAVTTGALPDGLTLASGGALSGTPTADGSFAFTITATDAMGFTASQAYTVAVISRPDPTRDAEVRGLLDAQAQATQRFANAQINNFQQRLESLHGAGARGLSNSLSLNARMRCPEAFRGAKQDLCTPQTALQNGASLADAPDSDLPATTAEGAWGAWIGGAIRSGSTDARNGAAGADFETDGLSAGADWRLSQSFVFGAGVGYGRDRSDVGERNSNVDGESFSVVAYASYHPGETFFLDGLLGYQDMRFDLRRFLTINGGSVTGARDGTQWFGSLSSGADIVQGNVQYTPYARLDVSRATLDAYTEQGDAVYALAYGEQNVDATTGNVGLRVEMKNDTDWGAFTPMFRAEYQHDFKADGFTTMRYADLISGPVYGTDVAGFDRSRWMLGLGANFVFDSDFSIRVEYRGVFGSSGDRDNALQLIFQKSY